MYFYGKLLIKKMHKVTISKVCRPKLHKSDKPAGFWYFMFICLSHTVAECNKNATMSEYKLLCRGVGLKRANISHKQLNMY